MTKEPTTAQLELVARHGSGPLERALAAVQLARRRGREAELVDLLGDTKPDRTVGVDSDGGPEPMPRSDGGSVVESSGEVDPSGDHPHQGGPEIVNVVASGSLGRELLLTDIGPNIDAEDVTYGADDYAPTVAYVHRRDDSPTLTVYPSGRYHLEGAESHAEAEGLLAWFCRELERQGIDGLSVTFEIENVVAIGDLGRKLDLHALWRRLGHEQAEYDPEQVDKALTYRPDQEEAEFRIHSTGSVQVYGDSESVVSRGFEWLHGQI